MIAITYEQNYITSLITICYEYIHFRTINNGSIKYTIYLLYTQEKPIKHGQVYTSTALSANNLPLRPHQLLRHFMQFAIRQS